MTIEVIDFSIKSNTWVDVSEPLIFMAKVNDTSQTLTSYGTYFELNNRKLNATISGIYPYIVTSDPVTISGNVDLYLHLTNAAYTDVKYYAFNFGYHAEYKDLMSDWGLNKEIIIKASVTNSAICPNTTKYCSYFVTEDYKKADLRSVITPRGWGDLYSNIKGQKAELLSGGNYTIKISGIKDFAGNLAEDIVFNFTVENIL